MANKKKVYMVVDTETATLPIVAELAHTADDKKKLAIAKPLIYDIGWTYCDRAGNILKTEQFLIAETFSVPSVFNTAYYKEKRPIYLQKLARGEISIKPWREVMDIFMTNLREVDGVGAFNSMFDFKKAIPFTELYINKLYSNNYFDWEKAQRRSCDYILTHSPDKSEKEFETDVFRFRGEVFPLFDLWGLSVTHLLNNVNYKNECLRHNLFTNSGTFFKTSAESTYQYLCDKYDFVESHTALDDAIIESFILSKIAQRHAINPGIEFFPFRNLGYTDDFVKRNAKPKKSDCETVFNAIAAYIDKQIDTKDDLSPYARGLVRRLLDLALYTGQDVKLYRTLISQEA